MCIICNNENIKLVNLTELHCRGCTSLTDIPSILINLTV